MDKINRQILNLLKEMLRTETIVNPCDIKGLVRFYNTTKSRTEKVKDYLDELTCYDIPKERIQEILEELKIGDFR